LLSFDGGLRPWLPAWWRLRRKCWSVVLYGFIGLEYAPGYWAGIGCEEEQGRPSWARVVSLPRERALLEQRLALVSDLARCMMEEGGEPVPIVLLPEGMG
jgi:hypothetical protein